MCGKLFLCTEVMNTVNAIDIVVAIAKLSSEPLWGHRLSSILSYCCPILFLIKTQTGKPILATHPEPDTGVRHS